MKFNLSSQQKELAKWFVDNVNQESLSEEFEIVWNDYETRESFQCFKDEKALKNLPAFTGGALDALEKEELISSQKYFHPAKKGSKPGESFRYGNPKYEYKRLITLRGKIYEAVNSDFGARMTGSLQNFIFINYRRADSEGYAGRIYDHLVNKYNEQSVYMDVDNIPKGVDFDKVLDPVLTSCNSFAAIIGPNWLSVLDEKGNRRLDDPKDLVRREIRRALERGIRFFPLLVGGAKMPKYDDLPDDIKEMAKMNAIVLRHDSWGSDIFKLTYELDSILNEKKHAENSVELKIFDHNSPAGQELRILETNNSNHVFGLELRNLRDEVVTGIIMDIWIFWEGNVTDDSMVFQAPAKHIDPAWETNDGNIRMETPAHLSINKPDLVIAFDHPKIWDYFRLSISKPQRIIGKFNLDYTLTTITPHSVTKGRLVIRMN